MHVDPRQATSLFYLKAALVLQLVPHYEEGVIYPLDADEVEERIGMPVKKGDLTDELVTIDQGLDVSTIDFLRTEWKDEWDNFVERMIAYEGVAEVMKENRISKEDITERHFLKSTNSIFSNNSAARMDLMIWASERGQMLSRCVVANCAGPPTSPLFFSTTVDISVIAAMPGGREQVQITQSVLCRTVKGMMMYAQALRQLEFLETMDSRDGMLPLVVEAKFRCAAIALCCSPLCHQMHNLSACVV